MILKYIVEARTKQDNYIRYELAAMTIEEMEKDAFYNKLKIENEYNLTLKPVIIKG